MCVVCKFVSVQLGGESLSGQVGSLRHSCKELIPEFCLLFVPVAMGDSTTCGISEDCGTDVTSSKGVNPVAR
jgi:hypothetical protein